MLTFRTKEGPYVPSAGQDSSANSSKPRDASATWGHPHIKKQQHNLVHPITLDPRKGLDFWLLKKCLQFGIPADTYWNIFHIGCTYKPNSFVSFTPWHAQSEGNFLGHFWCIWFWLRHVACSQESSMGGIMSVLQIFMIWGCVIWIFRFADA